MATPVPLNEDKRKATLTRALAVLRNKLQLGGLRTDGVNDYINFNRIDQCHR